MRFRRRGKLNEKYIRPLDIIWKIRDIAYVLVLPLIFSSLTLSYLKYSLPFILFFVCRCYNVTYQMSLMCSSKTRFGWMIG